MRKIRLSKLGAEQLQQLEELLNAVVRKASAARKAQTGYVAGGTHARVVAADNAAEETWKQLRALNRSFDELDSTADVEARISALRELHAADQAQAAAVQEQRDAWRASVRARKRLERALEPLLTASGNVFRFALELGDVGPVLEDAEQRPVAFIIETDTVCLQRVIAAAAHQARRAEDRYASRWLPWNEATPADQQSALEAVAVVLAGGELEREPVVAETIRAVAAELGLEVKS